MNKKVLIGVGLLALVGGIYYFMKNKKDAEAKSEEVAPTDKSAEITPAPATTTEVSTKTPIVATASKKEVRQVSKADKKTFKTDCGKRPTLKKNRALWQKCVDAQKLAEGSSFDGTKSMDIFSDISGGFENMDIL